MSEIEPIPLSPAANAAGAYTKSSLSGRRQPYIAFQREELDQIFIVYGRMVARGEWRDYAIDMLRDRAVFSVFRRASERPLYRIEKRPRLSRRQGAYCVIAMTGLILRRGHDLKKVLRAIDRQLKLVDA